MAVPRAVLKLERASATRAASCQCRVTYGNSFCATGLAGRLFDCAASVGSPSAFVSGSCLVGVFAQVDVPLVGDLVTTTQFCAR